MIVLRDSVFFASDRCCCTWRHLRFPTAHDPVMIVYSGVTMDQSTYLQSGNHPIYPDDEVDADFGVTDLEGVREVAWPYSEVDETERAVSAGR